MKEAVYQLPNPEEAWRKFLEFDKRLTHTVLKECRGSGIPIYLRDKGTSVEDLAEQVARGLGTQ